jgi:DNA-directed RNA polymerase specialized sigma24 family protein
MIEECNDRKALRQLERAFWRLSEEHRQIIRLHRLEGLTLIAWVHLRRKTS